MKPIITSSFVGVDGEPRGEVSLIRRAVAPEAQASAEPGALGTGDAAVNFILKGSQVRAVPPEPDLTVCPWGGASLLLLT